jgi:hypothetical protein
LKGLRDDLGLLPRVYGALGSLCANTYLLHHDIIIGPPTTTVK